MYMQFLHVIMVTIKTSYFPPFQTSLTKNIMSDKHSLSGSEFSQLISYIEFYYIYLELSLFYLI